MKLLKVNISFDTVFYIKDDENILDVIKYSNCILDKATSEEVVNIKSVEIFSREELPKEWSDDISIPYGQNMENPCEEQLTLKEIFERENK